MYKSLTALFCFFNFISFSQPGLSLQDCESRFLQNNLFLLAEQYNIEAAKASIIQARLWENPYFSSELNAANPQNRKAFDIQRNGQKTFAVQQLIYLGGKKRNEVELAKVNAEAAQWEFNDLLRKLRYQLRTSYFNVYYDEVAVATLIRQLANLDTLVKAYAGQVEKGNIPLKDFVRLQSLYMHMKSEQIALTNNIIDEKHTLAVLLSSDSAFVLMPTHAEISRYYTELSTSLEKLQELAAGNRTDVLWAAKNKEAAQWNLKWQKSLSVPDVTVGASYDQRGGAFNNQVNLTLGVPLRVWNKNQGNIRAADAQLSKAMLVKDQYEIQLRNEVSQAYQKYKAAISNHKMLDASLFSNFDNVYKGVYQNFQRRNITLIEFTDFMESYNQSLMQFHQIQKTLTNACEEINYTTATIQF